MLHKFSVQSELRVPNMPYSLSLSISNKRAILVGKDFFTFTTYGPRNGP